MKMLVHKATRHAINSKLNIQAKDQKTWLESQFSEELWTSTDTEGTSVVCFCMAVKCGYIKQVQQMLDERPELIEIINSNNGLTPLMIAVEKGSLPVARLLLSRGASPDQRSAVGQAPLHLAVYRGHVALIELLLDFGADSEVRDRNDLRVEHYAVDSGNPEIIALVFDRGGDLHVVDNMGWTPLFRAVIQGARLELIEDLIARGSDVAVVDRAGITLVDAARLLKDRRGEPRHALLRLVDPRYPHETALSHFTRLTKKISSVQSVFK